jgi:homoserine kinase type II
VTGAAQASGSWTREEVRTFLAGYGRAPRRLVVEQLRSWWWNVVLRVEADGERLVLRRYGVTPHEEVLWELALLRHLQAHDFPTIAPLPRPDGAPCGTFANQPAILYPYVEGHNGCRPELDRVRAMAEAAATIARLHRLTEGLALPHPRARSGADSRRLVRQFLAFTQERGVAPDEPALAEVVARAREVAAEFGARLAPVERDLPRGVVHHDAHCANVLFRDERLVALIDFDDACPSFLVADVAVLLENWAADARADALRPDHAAHVLRAYERLRPLTAAERDLLPDFLALYVLGDAVTELRDELARGTAGDPAVAACAGYRRFLRRTAGADWRGALRRAFQA